MQIQSTPQVIGPSQRRWSLDDYHQMIAAGILSRNERVELIHGYILEMVPQEPPHSSATSSFGNEFVLTFAGKAWIRQQLPLMIAPDSEPEPDIAVVRIDPRRYRDRHPTPDDVYFLIEVADSTLKYDSDRKAQLYAQAQIPEYWIIDVKQRQVLIMRNPQHNGYRERQVVALTDAISPIAFPEILIQLSDFWE
ncbi:MAG: Uma2 family endonuclease [Cyanothece sp. SIO2G6]|nr:Uma2 family endonuclease [Cyanothece sp. SIO2G6]